MTGPVRSCCGNCGAIVECVNFLLQRQSGASICAGNFRPVPGENCPAQNLSANLIHRQSGYPAFRASIRLQSFNYGDRHCRAVRADLLVRQIKKTKSIKDREADCTMAGRFPAIVRFNVQIIFRA